MNTSCIILNYNVEPLVTKLVKKISTYKSINYIVVVDNCSPDGSYERLKPLENKKIFVLKTEKNGGYGYGNNFGIRFSYEKLHAEQILICGPDVEFSEESLITMLDVLEKDCNCAMVTCVPYLPNGVFQKNSFWRIPKAIPYALQTCSVWNKLCKGFFYTIDDFVNQHICYMDCVLGSFLLIDSEIMVKYGMYDEDIFLFCEETVLGIMFKRSNFTTKVVLDKGYIHHHSVAIKKSISSQLERQRLLIDSKLLVLKRYYNIQGITYIIAKCILGYSIFERRLITIIKKFLDKEN